METENRRTELFRHPRRSETGIGQRSSRKLANPSGRWVREWKTYFFANALLGEVGYYSDGRFCMWNDMSDSIYTNLHPHFDTRYVVPKYSLTHREVSRSVARIVGLHQVWATHLGQAKAIRKYLFDRAAGRQ